MEAKNKHVKGKAYSDFRSLLFRSLVLSTAGQTVLAEGQSGTRAYGWHTLSITVKVSVFICSAIVMHHCDWLSAIRPMMLLAEHI